MYDDKVCFHFGDDEEITSISGNRRARYFMNKLKKHLSGQFLENVEFDYSEAKICLIKSDLNDIHGKLMFDRNEIDHIIGRLEMAFDREDHDIYL